METVPPGESENFYAIQNAFDTYWKSRDTEEKGKGWKPFKRWEWFWEQRVSPTGEFPNSMHLYNEYRKVVAQRELQPVQGSAASWSEIGPSSSPGGYAGLGRLGCVRPDPVDPNILWVGSAGGGLWKSTDGGLTWTTGTDHLPTLGVTDIAFDPVDPSTMYIATGDGDASDTYSIGVMKSVDGGVTWETTGLSWATSQTSLLNRVLVNPDDGNILIAAGSGIHRSTDAGATWVQTSSTRIFDLEFKPGDPTTMYASGNLSNVFRSTDGGASWTQMGGGFPTAGRRVALAVTAANPEYVYALVANASSGFLGVYRSTDGGSTWSMRANSPNLLGWEANGSDTGGQGWYDLAIAASPLDAEEIYTGGVNVWKSINGGTSWTISTMWYAVGGIANIHADQHDLYFLTGTSTLYAGNDGGIYRTTDHGSTWSWLGAGLRITQFYRFGNSQTDADRVIAGAQDNGTKMVNNTTWSDVIGGDGMEALIDYSDEDIMYGELYYGDIYRSMNGGISWAPISGGITESGGWITPYVIDPEDPATLYAGFRHVWKTTNRGTSWSIISNFGNSTLTLLEISPSNPDFIYAGTGGLIYRTTDGGATNWTTLTRPAGSGTTTDIAIHQFDPDHIWFTSSGYTAGQKVYESLDGGTTWTNISSNLPNVPVNCVLFQNNSPDRIYVGTDIGVWYRDQASPDWIEYNDGLANVVVTELEMQYATNKLRAATYGRGVWESDAVENTGAVIGISHSTVDFGRVEAGTTSGPVVFSMTNLGTVDTLTVTTISVGDEGFAFSSVPDLPADVGPGESLELSILFQPDEHGTFSDTIAVESNATNTASLRIPLDGLGVVIGQAAPGILYAATDSLYTVDRFTGAVSGIGWTGGRAVTSLSVRPATGELYGLADDGVTGTVYRLSASYGDAVVAQTFPVPLLRAIAFSEDDILYGVVAFGAGAGTLWRLDLTTGDAEEIGTSGLYYSSLSFDPGSGTLFASERPPVGTKDRIYTIDTETGSATLVGQVGDPLRITAALSFDDQGELFGITGNGQFENELVMIDPSTGAGTVIAGMGTYNLSSLAIRVDSMVTGIAGTVGDVLPGHYVLDQNYPNPFNPVTEIGYGLPQQSNVRVTVYNTIGQQIRELVNGEQAAGYHRVVWNGTNADGGTVASGLYLYRIDATGADGTQFTRIRKMILLR